MAMTHCQETVSIWLNYTRNLHVWHASCLIAVTHAQETGTRNLHQIELRSIR